MGKEKIENLGFGEVNSWDNEEQVSSLLPSTKLTSITVEETKSIQENSRNRQNGRAKHIPNARQR